MLQGIESGGASTQRDWSWLEQPLYISCAIPQTADKESLTKRLHPVVTALLLQVGICVQEIWGQPGAEACKTGAFFKYIRKNPWLSRCINQNISSCDHTASDIMYIGL